MVEAGRVELPSEKGPRKASTGLVCVRVFASGDARRRASFSYPAVSSSPAPREEKARTSPMGLTPRRRIRLQPLRRDDRGRQGAFRLGSVGVVVIVVGNYFDAAFNEASGASTCSHGFQHPRRNHCAPIRRAVLTDSEDHSPQALAVRAEPSLNKH